MFLGITGTHVKLIAENSMANDDHIAQLRKGVSAWNAWRKENPDIRPDLSKANLDRAYLSGADLAEADLPEANLSKANLSKANLTYALLIGADLGSADLRLAGLGGAYLRQ